MAHRTLRVFRWRRTVRASTPQLNWRPQMGVEKVAKRAFAQLFRVQGQAIEIHKGYGSTAVRRMSQRGLFAVKAGERGGAHVRFQNRVELVLGDVLQVRGSADLWRVV